MSQKLVTFSYKNDIKFNPMSLAKNLHINVATMFWVPDPWMYFLIYFIFSFLPITNHNYLCNLDCIIARKYNSAGKGIADENIHSFIYSAYTYEDPTLCQALC